MKIFQKSILSLLFSITVFYSVEAQKLVLNKPLSISLSANKNTIFGDLTKGSYLTNNFTNSYGFHVGLNYRIWENWGFSLHYNHSFHPVDAKAAGTFILNERTTNRSVLLTANKAGQISQFGFGPYFDFPILGDINLRVLPYFGYSILSNPSIVAQVQGEPNYVMEIGSGKFSDLFYGLNLMPSYVINKELTVYATINSTYAKHNILLEGDATYPRLNPGNSDVNYFRLDFGIGFTYALPIIQIPWKY